MTKTVVFDPTQEDKLSRVRGVGRYLQILKENFSNEFVFTNKLTADPCQSTGVFINPFFNFLQAPLLMKKIYQRQIAVIHDLIPLKYPSHFPIGVRSKLNVFLNKLALKNYDLIVTDSQTSKKDIIDILDINEGKIKVIYPTLPFIFNSEFKIYNSELNSKSKILNSKQNSEFKIPNSKFVLYVGDATWNKNLVNLARAVKKINVTCVFVGKVFYQNSEFRVQSSESNLKSKILNSKPNSEFKIPNSKLLSHPWQKELYEFYREIANDKRFILLSYVPDDKLIALYQNAACNILISRDEGFGFSFLEASSQNCPTILSDIPVFRELAGESPLLNHLVSPDKIDDIAHKIGEVYFDNNLRNKLGLEAKKRIDFFSADKFRQLFLEAINK